MQADGLDAEERLGIPGDHRGILMDERFFRVMKHWLKAGDPDPFYNPYTDFVILPAKEFEIEDHKEETISMTGSSLDMDNHTGASQQGVYIATVSTGTASYFNVIVSLVIIRIVRFHCLFFCKSRFPGLLSLSSCLIRVLSLLFPFF